MKSKAILISGSVLVAAWMSSGTVQGQSSGTKGETIHPPITGPAGSTGGSKSERGPGNVPLPEGSRESGTVEMGKRGGTTGRIMAAPQGQKEKGFAPGPLSGKTKPRPQAPLKHSPTRTKVQRARVLA